MSYPQRIQRGYLSFSQGLMTELSPLRTPEELEGTTADELNMTVKTDGMIRVRRDGVGFIPGIELNIPGFVVLDARYWKRANCYVVLSYNPTPVDDQYELYTVFMDKTDSVKNRGYQHKMFVSDFVKPSIAFLRTKCLVTYGGRPILCTRNADLEFTLEYINLYIRDFKLLDDGNTVTQRPATLQEKHEYNLLNAGWYQDRVRKDPVGAGDPVENFHLVRTEYPSNADIAYLGDITNNNGDLVFDPVTFDNINLGATEAPRGHYVFDIRNIDRSSRVSNKENDGSPPTTLDLLVVNGTDPGTGSPPTGDIDDPYPEVPPGTQIP